jgi:excisionase family DNA binding protein
MPRATFGPGPRSLLTIAMAAEQLEVSKRTVERMILDGRLPHLRVTPTIIRIDPDALDAFKRGRIHAS